MTGADAAMLYTETDTSTMHTLKVSVLDVSGVAGTYDRQRVIDELRPRLHLLPQFRQRIQKVPTGIHHPLWVDDADFDLDAHVHEMAVDPPGDRRALDRAMSVIHSTPLHRDRPLWEATLLTGLADERVAVVVKIHHALADGLAAATSLAHVLGVGDEIPEPEPWEPEPVPGSLSLFLRAVLDRVVQLRRLPDLVRRTLRGRKRRQAIVQSMADVPPTPMRGPTASFNGPLTVTRSIATARFDFADFRTVRHAHDCTINDVLLAVTGGALRRMVDARGERLEASMTCAIPVALDTTDATRRQGNQVTQLFTSLWTNLDDPVERLRRIHAVTKNAKVLNAEAGPELSRDWNEWSSSAPYQLVWRTVMPHVKRAPVNIVVSNVPGPRQPLRAAGIPIVEFYSASVLTEGVGLNLTVWSYLGGMYAGFTTCPTLLPDAHEFTDAMADALAELVERSA
jgi:diacylglycerol O-acyltransferase